MPTRKTFKRRVRARMTKTGESYTAARHQLLRKAGEGADASHDEDTAVRAPGPAAGAGIVGNAAAATTEPVRYATSAETIRRATGRGHEEWFGLLDGWGASERRHPEIARWLQEAHGVGGWWAQSITVDYERARGLRARHQNSGGFSVSASRTIAVGADRLLAAFTDPAVRRCWLPDVEMELRPTKAAMTARFHWREPDSRVVVTVAARGERKATVVVTHEQLPGAGAVEEVKAAWRDRLGELKKLLEASPG